MCRGILWWCHFPRPWPTIPLFLLMVKLSCMYLFSNNTSAYLLLFYDFLCTSPTPSKADFECLPKDHKSLFPGRILAHVQGAPVQYCITASMHHGYCGALVFCPADPTKFIGVGMIIDCLLCFLLNHKLFSSCRSWNCQLQYDPYCAKWWVWHNICCNKRCYCIKMYVYLCLLFCLYNKNIVQWFHHQLHLPSLNE